MTPAASSTGLRDSETSGLPGAAPSRPAGRARRRPAGRGGFRDPAGPVRLFAYGSNLCSRRLRERAPSARFLAPAALAGHALRFHKLGRDGSGKADAWETGRPDDTVWGALFEIDPRDQRSLDAAEDLGRGYRARLVQVTCRDGRRHRARMYAAAPQAIRADLRPFSWYLELIVAGAAEQGLPADYIASLRGVPCREDPDRRRDRRMRALLAPTAADAGQSCTPSSP